MNAIYITFAEGGKEYLYKSKLNLIPGEKYKIVVETGHTYNDAIVNCVRFIKGVDFSNISISNIGTIVSATCIQPKPVDYTIANIYENIDKGVTTVLWTDGDKTILKLHEEDNWDREKVIALAYMKKHYKNRGRFNNELRKWNEILCARVETNEAN